MYVEAYNNKTRNTAQLFGFFVNVAVSCSIREAFGEDGSNYYEVLKKIEDSKPYSADIKEQNFQDERKFWSKLKQRQRE